MPGLLFRLRPQNLPSQHPLPAPFRCLRTSAILNPPVTLFHFQSSLSFGYEAWRVLTIPAVATVTALVARARRDRSTLKVPLKYCIPWMFHYHILAGRQKREKALSPPCCPLWLHSSSVPFELSVFSFSALLHGAQTLVLGAGLGVSSPTLHPHSSHPGTCPHRTFLAVALSQAN